MKPWILGGVALLAVGAGAWFVMNGNASGASASAPAAPPAAQPAPAGTAATGRDVANAQAWLDFGVNAANALTDLSARFK